MKVEIGTKFRWSYADANPTWEVKSRRGASSWNCEIVDCSDYSGTKKVFGTEEILGSLRMAAHWQKTFDDSDKFFARQEAGDIVHYKNGDGYVRCVIQKDGKLLPVALVGEWREFDLPRRMPNGFINYGYHVTQIREKKTFRPHASLIWEYQHRAGEANPTRMPTVNIELPEMTPAEKTEADKHIRLNHLRGIVNDNDLSPDDIFQRVKNFFDPEAI